MRVPHHRNDWRNEVAMTPMIDVVFLLMIFFVCTAGFQASEQILSSNLLVTGETGSAIQNDLEPIPEKIVIKVNYLADQPTWMINDRPQTGLSDVVTVLRQYAQIDAGLPVILDVAGAVPLGHVIEVYDVCQLAGFDQIQFAASVKFH